MSAVLMPRTRVCPRVLCKILNLPRYDIYETSTCRPESQGFALLHECVRGTAAAVYDVTIAYTRRDQSARPAAPSLADIVTRRFADVHVHVARIPMVSIPTDPELLSHWLIGRFKEKDRLLNDFYAGKVCFVFLFFVEAGTCINRLARKGFSGPSWSKPMSRWAAVSRACLWGALFYLSFATRTGRRLYSLQWLVAGVGGIAIMSAARAPSTSTSRTVAN
jgi:hypothetical protein